MKTPETKPILGTDLALKTTKGTDQNGRPAVDRKRDRRRLHHSRLVPSRRPDRPSHPASLLRCEHGFRRGLIVEMFKPDGGGSVVQPRVLRRSPRRKMPSA